MNRRRFFELMGWGAVTSVAYSFLGTGSIYVPSRNLTLSTNLTLAEWAKTMDPNGQTSVMAKLLAQSNEILEDMVFKPCKLPPIRIESVLPDSTLRDLRTGMTYVSPVEDFEPSPEHDPEDNPQLRRIREDFIGRAEEAIEGMRKVIKHEVFDIERSST